MRGGCQLAAQLGGARGDRGIVLGGLGDGADLPRDIFSHLALLSGCAGHLFGHQVDALDRYGDAVEGGFSLDHPLHPTTRLAAALPCDRHGLNGHALQVGNDALDGLGGLLGLGRQGAHFIGDHGEATSLLASACGFDGRVQGQQVGLFGDGANHVRRLLDRPGFAGEAGNRSADLVHGLCQLLHHHSALLRLLGALQRKLADLSGFLGSLLHMAGHLGDRCRHLVHGGGRHFRLDPLRLQGLLGLLHQLAIL
ncbi:hypothetical protein D3C84_708170 [compost metagenome]